MTAQPKMPHIYSLHDASLRDFPRVPGCTAVLGNFDGVHRGHQALLAAARAARPGQPVVVLSFEPHPREFFALSRGGDVAGFRLTLAAQKERLLRRFGADHVVLMAFDEALSRLAPQDFITRVLTDRLGAGHVCVGADFAFGAGRSGTAETLRTHGAQAGFGVTVCAPVCDDGGQVFASSRVRASVAAGDFSVAAYVLGHDWCVSAPVVKGAQRGRALGFPTANQTLARLQLPPYGIYAVRARLAGEALWRAGVASLGIRPMFAVSAPLLETHIFDFAQEIYGNTLDVQPVEFLRAEATFDSLDALVAQMKQDCLDARAVLKSGSL